MTKQIKFVLSVAWVLVQFAAMPALAAPTNASQNSSVVNGNSIDLSAFDHLDPQHLIADAAIRRAVTYLKANAGSFNNKNYLAVVDFTKASNQQRMYLVNLKTGGVETHLTTHGMGSDPKNTMYAQRFSNAESSNESSLGFYRTADVYVGKHGESLRLDGLSSTNSNARARAIVIHAAWYVSEDADHAGRSQGCFAVDPVERAAIIDKLKDGALIYAWAGQGH